MPWFLTIIICLNLVSFLKSRALCRYTPSIICSWSISNCVQSASWSGVSITTSWAPTAFIISYIPCPLFFRSPSILSSGNLSGITLTFHFSLLSPPTGSFTVNISTGDLLSFPGQKGQICFSSSVVVVIYSENLFFLSSETIIHLLIIGSFLSSDISLSPFFIFENCLQKSYQFFIFNRFVNIFICALYKSIKVTVNLTKSCYYYNRKLRIYFFYIFQKFKSANFRHS